MSLRALFLAAMAALPLWAADFTYGYAVSLGESSQLVEVAHADESFTLLELLQAAVSQSDNNACAHLFRLVGGAALCSNFSASACRAVGGGRATTLNCFSRLGGAPASHPHA